MTNTPLSNRILFGFYTFIVLAVGLSALIWPGFRALAYAPLRDLLFPNAYIPTTASAPVDLVIAVPPRLEAWVKANAVDFNKQNQFITVNVIVVRGLEAGQRLNALTGQTDAWVGEADFARKVASGIPYLDQGAPLAQESFVWVAAKTRGDLAANINWLNLAKTAKSDVAFRIALPPVNSLEGMAACWGAAQEYHKTSSPTQPQINDPAFRAWLNELLLAAPDRNRNPKDQLATRPPQAEAGLILTSDWPQLSQSVFNRQPSTDGVVFNYPYYIRSNWTNLQPVEIQLRQEAAAKFRDYLLSTPAQNKLGSYGLERLTQPVNNALNTVDESIIRALQFCWQ